MPHKPILVTSASTHKPKISKSKMRIHLVSRKTKVKNTYAYMYIYQQNYSPEAPPINTNSRLPIFEILNDFPEFYQQPIRRMQEVKKIYLLQDHEYIEAIPLPLRTLSLSITSAQNTQFSLIIIIIINEQPKRQHFS